LVYEEQGHDDAVIGVSQVMNVINLFIDFMGRVCTCLGALTLPFHLLLSLMCRVMLLDSEQSHLL
jgi:hypothetical protein